MRRRQASQMRGPAKTKGPPRESLASRASGTINTAKSTRGNHRRMCGFCPSRSEPGNEHEAEANPEAAHEGLENATEHGLRHATEQVGKSVRVRYSWLCPEGVSLDGDWQAV